HRCRIPLVYGLYRRDSSRLELLEGRLEAQFNAHKFNELIVYIATRLGPEAALGRTKLAKLLMKSDFGAYARRGQPTTGATYEKWEQGHLPRELLLAQRDLE